MLKSKEKSKNKIKLKNSTFISEFIILIFKEK